MILYFSGTGNSEYVAKYLAHLCDDEVVNMGQYIRSGVPMKLFSPKPYLIVAPVYISTLPVVVLDLLKKSTLTGNSNVYFIMTCAGSGISAAAAYAQPLCEKLGLIYRGTEHLSMPQNYLMFFTTAEDAQNKEKMDAALTLVPELAQKVRDNEDFDRTKVGLAHKLSIEPVIWIFDAFCIKPKKFRATDACIGCSVCEKVCALNNIQMKNGKPVWGKNCCHCSACINRCPKKAIEYGKATVGKNRYVAPKFKAEQK
jgi:NAD-dependent dihydropyrimidine dehydrogenase PreA subunit